MWPQSSDGADKMANYFCFTQSFNLSIIFRGRLMVGRLVLVQLIGVQIPASEQKYCKFIYNARGSSNGPSHPTGLIKRQVISVSFKILQFIYNARGSSNGRTAGFGPVNRGSTPCPRALQTNYY